ncbi:hypothetical protein COS79_02660 [Candidatus Woesearchaeota archaeon CG06_land_8_20_14_3_00_33_13]|nr:MAG: hypothetical protein COV14_04135 [Candidatus Woesearchaeota archaeon CG10_big_fil_rev_8_21_14_0_10_33_12]PIU72503.1 MAG: hypothetical protein COS79_02660 [Candidatus Woesearchaeota archaeon CG06_land_8_20_14_3_00_33_13]
MRKFVKKEDKYTNSVSEYSKGRWVTRYFYFFCDICGARHPDKCVNNVYPEEGFEKEADLCHDCQKKMYKKERDIFQKQFSIVTECSGSKL